ncbi:MAG: hypothetical protein GTO45_04205 [Candidatus Aminicenantes bacterium]|nr:hypothetical protein [Candidatus Aminicenantes bacterium]NIM82273.1 hypothetical protein [Candidatus Aminicenantes bacterium]NIN17271.1 hypothetical protein [Candidatus Aminicenantes bacterium]NIN41140.1 hypothetical protein [Candidatus Aminicenantes bacterium]NIN83939.1 hypothetical protein [Candidatus Aminicenantes bacterium]
MKKLSLFVILILLASLSCYGVIWMNYSECAYTGQCEEEGRESSGGWINQLIIEGAGYFLQSHSDFQLFLNRIELSELYGTNFKELRIILYMAGFNMNAAKGTYFELKAVSGAIPYNPIVIDKLRTFDYERFLEEKGLNSAVFSRVKGFLIKGDVTGAYESVFSDTVDLLDRLENIKKDIDKDTIPDISKLWELNQKYSDALFFGQYISMIFKEIQ